MPELPSFDRNGRLLLAAKAARAFAFGLNSVALGLYLAELGVGGPEIGVILGGALFGTLLLTLVIALRGDHVGRRRVLIAGSLLMLLALLIPVAGTSVVVLALLGLSGMVAVTSNEGTGLHAVDLAVLPQTVPEGQRTPAFAVYGVVAFVASAIGSAALGPLVFLGEQLGLEGADRYLAAFTTYALAGIVAAVLAARLDRQAELGERLERGFGVRRSRTTVARLSGLFALDSFASGLIVQSFLALWLASQFGLGAGTVGVLFFAGSLLGASSLPIAARLAGRIGLIRTMVFTHIPANLLLIGMALLPPSAAGAAAILFLARSVLSSMDIPARQSYVMSVVDPAERTATAGVISVARSGAQAVGPFAAGAFLIPLGLGVPLLACGALKTAYDVLLFVAFRSRPAPGEAPAGPYAAITPAGPDEA